MQRCNASTFMVGDRIPEWLATHGIKVRWNGAQRPSVFTGRATPLEVRLPEHPARSIHD